MGRLRGIVAGAAALFILLAPAGFPQEGGEIISISKRDFVAGKLHRAGLDLLEERGGRVYALVSRPEMARLTSEGIPFSYETFEFLPPAAAQGTSEGGINGAYHSTFELETDLWRLQSEYPDLLRVVDIGESLEGRKIRAMKISDNPALEEEEAAVFFLGCHHAREWISVEVPYLFGEYLLEHYGTDPRVRDLVDRSEIWVVPLVNPDGLEYSIHVYRYWRKNRRANADGSYGVDLNRNYGYRWGFDDLGSSPDPSSGVYRGPAPFSEPETRAVRDMFLQQGPQALVSFHSYSQVILYPWGYANVPTPADAELRDVARTMSDLMASVRGTVYGFGRAAASLYLTNGDTTDWSFGLAGIPSFTIELPPVDIQEGGFFNAESEIDGIFLENLPAMLYLAEYAVDRFTESGPRTRLTAERPARPLSRPKRTGRIR
jgi:carboxypeptidase T